MNVLYRHVNGKWLDEFEIPADKSNYGAFTVLSDKAREDVKATIEAAAAESGEPGSDTQKVGDMYRSFMDIELLEELGPGVLNAELAAIDAIENLGDLSEYMAYADILTSAPFGVFVCVDVKNPESHVTIIGQSGPGLPDRAYYLDDDEKSQKIRRQYVKHIATMFSLAGLDNGADRAQQVMSIETQLAEQQWEKEANRDPVKTYNKLSFDKLKQLAPSLDWDRWAAATGIRGIDNVVVRQPSYIQAMESMLTSVELDEWKTYFRWHLITSTASSMNTDLDNENFRFYRGVLSGVKEQEPRWKRAVSTVNSTIGEIVGKIYVEQHFTEEARQRMADLVENLRLAYDEGIDGLEWMGEDARLQAKDKLSKFRPKIGYPDKWKDYSKLEIAADDLIGNMKRATLVATQLNRDKLSQPIDRDEWFMNPQTVNAYYNPSLNEIVFPAAYCNLHFSI